MAREDQVRVQQYAEEVKGKYVLLGEKEQLIIGDALRTEGGKLLLRWLADSYRLRALATSTTMPQDPYQIGSLAGEMKERFRLYVTLRTLQDIGKLP